MAVQKKNIGGNDDDETSPANSLHKIILLLQSLELIEPQLNSDESIMEVCNHTIDQLINTPIPLNSNDIKEFKNVLQLIGEVLKRILQNAEQSEQIFISCLQTLYTAMAIIGDKSSAAAGIIFGIYDEASVPKAIKLLLKDSANLENNDALKKVISTLCFWLRFSGLKNLSKCIIELLDALREHQKYDLLMDIANSITEQLFLSLIVPCIRSNSLSILSYILCSAQSWPLFEKILPRIPKVFLRIEIGLKSTTPDPTIEQDLQLLVDLISAFIVRFKAFDGKYEEITKALRGYEPSANFEKLLDAKPWHPPITILERDPSIPIGLVNMGNTCYMNSVLQALFMTKQFTRDILLMKLPSKIINYIQQLFSLLLYSKRLQLIPRDVLSERPQSFRYGHQQDGFEYLGFLLDKLHEEENKYLKIANVAKNAENNYNLSNGIKLKNGARNGEQMDIDGNSLENQTISIHASAMTNESDDSINLGEQMDPDGNNLNNRTISIHAPALTTESDDGINSGEMKNTNGMASNDIETKKTTETSTVQTMIQKLFGGRLSIHYKCLKCSTQSTNIDNFFDLQLSFPHTTDPLSPVALIDRNKYTTQSLLSAYFMAEQMVNDDQYYCEKCEMLCDGERNITLEQAPSNLILVIKHFKYDRKFHLRRKLLSKVYHDEVVSIVTTSPSNNERVRFTYKLYAVIVHSGMNIDSGHYYTFSVDGMNNWFKFNDNHISRSSFNDIRNLNDLNTPYILFYEMIRSEKIDASDVDTTVTHAIPPELHVMAETNSNVMTNDELQCRKSENPNWDDLPPKLQEFVRRDNSLYVRESRQKSYGNELVKNFYNKHRKSDSDQDPPSSCGGNAIGPSNQYIY